VDPVARQLIRALRGRRSQLAFSRRLGYRSNVAADWEQGRRFPTGAEMLRAAQVVGVDVVAVLTAFNDAAAPRYVAGLDPDHAVASWLEGLRGRTSIQALSERTGRSRHAVGRWLSGATRPRLPDFLGVVDALTGRVEDLVGGLVDIRSVPALADRQRRAHASRRVGLDEPWALPVLLALETRGYAALAAHDDAFLAERLGLTQDRVQSCLARLAAAGIIEKPAEHWVVGGALTIDTSAHPEAGRALKRHWSMVAQDRIGAPRAGDILGYNLFAVSAADLDRIRTLQRQFFREVRGIVAASEPSEAVALLNVQLVTWEE
jgi:transcriptional regulator with XRE-family HTH domain